MAAQAEHGPKGPQIVELRSLGSQELNRLLLEETAEWEQELDWDFSKSADLVRRYADMRALGGAALLDQGEVAGYGYSVLEDQKGLIGDLYVRPGWRGGDAEIRLFRVMLDSLIASGQVRRMESQLMLVGHDVARALQRERFVRLFERLLLRIDASAALPAVAGRPMGRFLIACWADSSYDDAAQMLAHAYDGHSDSQINEQYRSTAGARRFLHNIVQYPGCGEFCPEASLVARDNHSGKLAGIVLTSFISRQTAHITQLCVAPEVQGLGLGRHLLQQAMVALRVQGAGRISLTVTASNTAAVELYRRCGFQELRRFFAYVWEAYQTW